MLKQYNGLYNIDYKIQVIQCNECHLERCLSGKYSTHKRIFQLRHDCTTVYTQLPVACPGIRKERGGGCENLKVFFFCFSIFQQGGGPAQKIAEKMIFPTKKVAKYR